MTCSKQRRVVGEAKLPRRGEVSVPVRSSFALYRTLFSHRLSRNCPAILVSLLKLSFFLARRSRASHQDRTFAASSLAREQFSLENNMELIWNLLKHLRWCGCNAFLMRDLQSLCINGSLKFACKAEGISTTIAPQPGGREEVFRFPSW